MITANSSATIAPPVPTFAAPRRSTLTAQPVITAVPVKDADVVHRRERLANDARTHAEWLTLREAVKEIEYLRGIAFARQRDARPISDFWDAWRQATYPPRGRRQAKRRKSP